MNSINIIIIIICVILSGYFSATETAFTSFNKIRVKNMAEKGNKRAKLVLKLSGNFDKLLSTILIGNNIVNIATASLATIIFVGFLGDVGVSVSTVVTTIVVLIFGEVSPKSLAKESPEKFAMFSAPVLRCLMVIFTPFNFFFVQWKKLLSKIFKSKEDRSITDEELLTIVEEAQQEGGIDKDEGELIKNAIEFDDLQAEDVLTPRMEIEGVPRDADKEKMAEVFKKSGYSRLPVFEKNIDRIVGVIHQKDFHNYIYRTARPIDDILKPVIFITKATKISELLKALQKTKSHMAVVVDEYGGTVGIVTMEDILEELVGEIWDEHDEIIQEIEKIDDHTYKVLGCADLDTMFEYFGMDEEAAFFTVNGWLVNHMQRIPEVGDKMEYGRLSIEIIKTESKRILEVLIKTKS